MKLLMRGMMGLAVAGLAASAAYAQSASPFPDPRTPSAASPFPNPNAPAPSANAPSPFPNPSATTATPVAPVFRAPAASGGMGGGFAAPQQPQAQNNCMDEFLPLRDDAQRKGQVLSKAKNKTAKQACGIVGSFATAHLKMLNYVHKNSARCGIPAQIEQNIRAEHAQIAKLQKNVCDAAAAAPRQTGPSFSDALGGPTASNGPARGGGTTFDTLNGNVLSR